MARTVCCMVVLLLAITSFSAEAQNLDHCNSRRIDLVFLLDSSGSIGQVNFNNILGIINQVIDLLNIDSLDGIRVGFIVFSTDVSPIGVDLQQFSDRASIKLAINNAPYLAGGTMTHLALGAAETMYANLGRRDAERLAILITDGRSEAPSATLAASISLRIRQDVQIAAIGITNQVRQSELRAISTRGMVFQSDSFDLFVAEFGQFTAVICEISSPCWNCEYENGVYYSDDATRCHGYFNCRSPGDSSPQRRLCSPDTFWTQDGLGCDHIAAVNCRNDPCVLDTSVNRWAYPGSCRIYIICDGNRSLTSGCCLDGEAFDPLTEACVPDATCVDECPGAPTPDVQGCNFSPVAGEPTRFLNNFTGTIEFCPTGFAYVAATCGCWQRIGPVLASCDPEVEITFSGGNVVDTTGNTWLDVRNVAAVENVAGTEDGWAGEFNGASAIGIPRFTGSDFGSYLQIVVRYLIVDPSGIPNLDDREILVSNGNCGDDPTVFLGYDRLADDNIAHVRTVAGDDYETFATNQAGNWMTSRLIYDTSQLQVSTDSSLGNHAEQSIGVDPAAKIQRAFRALWIGGVCCPGSQSLFNVTALIDRVTIYLCEP